jgi:hypothetical protein
LRKHSDKEDLFDRILRESKKRLSGLAGYSQGRLSGFQNAFAQPLQFSLSLIKTLTYELGLEKR